MDEAELLLSHRVEDVALILARIDRPQQTVRRAAGRIPPLDAGVVAGSQAIGADHPGALHQVAELHVPVALQAGIRRPPGGVLVDEPLHHRLAELPFHIDGVEGDADAGAGHPRVVHGRDAAAGIGPVVGIVGREEAQVDADRPCSRARA